MPEDASSEVRFRSRAHPGNASFGLAVSRLLATPLAACTLPVMIAALVAALEGYSLLPFLYTGFPAAMLIAFLWSRFRMQATLAEVFVDGDRAAVRSVWDLIRRTGGPDWYPVLDVRRDGGGFTMTLGLDVYELKLEDWPEGERLIDELRQARMLGARPSP